ncbi:MAG TPA: hypothetical protein VIQ00_00610 [Chitinophagaceae bacterium]|jgi:hypothetical protein
MKNGLLFSFIALLFVSCGPKIYKSTEFDAVASRHKIVAILPANVNIKLRPNEAKKITPEDLKKNEETTGYAIQDKLYSWFLRRSEKKGFTVKFQDVSKTNSTLKTAGLEYADLTFKSKEELAKLLQVDAVITTGVRMDKPMSEGAALAVGIVFGSWGATNNALVTINIHEAKAGDLIWKYDYQASGSVGSSPENIVNALMKNASKKFPYNNN